jgi:hypothetical protein
LLPVDHGSCAWQMVLISSVNHKFVMLCFLPLVNRAAEA